VITLANAVSEFGIVCTVEFSADRLYVYTPFFFNSFICAMVLFSIHCPIKGISVLR